MKRTYALLAIAAVFLVVLLSIRFTGNQSRSAPESTASNIMYNSTPIASSSQESSEINAMASRTDVYTVREYEGRIGVFYNDENVPYQQIDVDVTSLPTADQDALRAGIKVYSTDKLNQMIEDYES